MGNLLHKYISKTNLHLHSQHQKQTLPLKQAILIRIDQPGSGKHTNPTHQIQIGQMQDNQTEQIQMEQTNSTEHIQINPVKQKGNELRPWHNHKHNKTKQQKISLQSSYLTGDGWTRRTNVCIRQHTYTQNYTTCRQCCCLRKSKDRHQN